MDCLNGALIYDREDAEYNRWFVDHIISVGREYNFNIKLFHSEDLVENEVLSSDFVILRNRDYELAKLLEDHSVRCFNQSDVVRIGNDKYKMYEAFYKAGIPQMHTEETKITYPFVVKPRNGHGGQDVYLVKNDCEYEKIADKIDNGVIYQIPASEKGRDIRVYVLGGEVLAAMERCASDSEADFRANFSLGGYARAYSLNEEEHALVKKVIDYLNPDFVGVDIIYDNGHPVINEIEDAVGTRMLYKYTDIDPVREYLKWMDRTLRQ